MRADMAQFKSSSTTSERNANLDKKTIGCKDGSSSVVDVSLGTEEIAGDVNNNGTGIDVATVEPNANVMTARSNVNEKCLTVGNDSSDDTEIPALMGTIKTYSAVINGLKDNPKTGKIITKKRRKMIRDKSKNCSIKFSA